MLGNAQTERKVAIWLGNTAVSIGGTVASAFMPLSGPEVFLNELNIRQPRWAQRPCAPLVLFHV
jgi:hypothetical protein